MKFWTSSALIIVLLASLMGFAVFKPAAAATVPTFDIIAVVKDSNVTIKTANFPANRTFEVRMGKIGTRAVGGILVGTTDSGSGGSFTATYNIPAELKGLSQISIRMDSKTGGFFSYNWFNNTTQGSTTTTPNPTATRTPTRTPTGGSTTPTRTPTPRPTVTVPTFSIQSVSRDSSVTIKTANFPANRTFEVRMGKFGTRGVNGILVGATDSGSGGSFTATYNIPAELKGLKQIAIRMDSKTGGFFSFNWFWNSNAP